MSCFLRKSYVITDFKVLGKALIVFDVTYNSGMINKYFVANGLIVNLSD